MRKGGLTRKIGSWSDKVSALQAFIFKGGGQWCSGVCGSFTATLWVRVPLRCAVKLTPWAMAGPQPSANPLAGC